MLKNVTHIAAAKSSNSHEKKSMVWKSLTLQVISVPKVNSMGYQWWPHFHAGLVKKSRHVDEFGKNCV